MASNPDQKTDRKTEETEILKLEIMKGRVFPTRRAEGGKVQQHAVTQHNFSHKLI